MTLVTRSVQFTGFKKQNEKTCTQEGIEGHVCSMQGKQEKTLLGMRC